MPIYMDRHDIPEEITAEHVAKMHQEDLKIEHLYDCKGMTYWCDEKRKTAFCLIEAPNKKAIQDMHNHAHGDFPHQIIEVNPTIVESFLGRIEDPEKSKNTKLNIINDPAFRTLMSLKLERKIFSSPINGSSKQILLSLTNTIKELKGRIVKQENGTYLVSFDSVTNAVLCALKCQSNVNKAENPSHFIVRIGLCAGVPVTKQQNIFEDTIKMANYLRDISQSVICITSEVKNLYESENLNKSIDKSIKVLDLNAEGLLNTLMGYLESEWNNPSLNVERLCSHLGLSKSQANRKIKSLTTKSINPFIQEIRLQKSLTSLKTKTRTISQVAYDSGFTSPTYFSRAFKKRFGITPKELD